MENEKQPNQEQTKKCSQCGELIKKEAKKCRYCGNEMGFEAGAKNVGKGLMGCGCAAILIPIAIIIIVSLLLALF